MRKETVRNFHGGLNKRQASHRLAETELAEAYNIDFSKGDLRGMYKQIPGGRADGIYYRKGGTWYAYGTDMGQISVSNTTRSQGLNYPNGHDWSNGSVGDWWRHPLPSYEAYGPQGWHSAWVLTHGSIGDPLANPAKVEGELSAGVMIDGSQYASGPGSTWNGGAALGGGGWLVATDCEHWMKEQSEFTIWPDFVTERGSITAWVPSFFPYDSQHIFKWGSTHTYNGVNVEGYPNAFFFVERMSATKWRAWYNLNDLIAYRANGNSGLGTYGYVGLLAFNNGFFDYDPFGGSSGAPCLISQQIWQEHYKDPQTDTLFNGPHASFDPADWTVTGHKGTGPQIPFDYAIEGGFEVKSPFTFQFGLGWNAGEMAMLPGSGTVNQFSFGSMLTNDWPGRPSWDQTLILSAFGDVQVAEANGFSRTGSSGPYDETCLIDTLELRDFSNGSGTLKTALEYNDDLYMVRDSFNIKLQTSAGSKVAYIHLRAVAGTNPSQPNHGSQNNNLTWYGADFDHRNQLSVGDRLYNNYDVTRNITYTDNDGDVNAPPDAEWVEDLVIQNEGRIIKDGTRILEINHDEGYIIMSDPAIISWDHPDRTITPGTITPGSQGQPPTTTPPTITYNPPLWFTPGDHDNWLASSPSNTGGQSNIRQNQSNWGPAWWTNNLNNPNAFTVAPTIVRMLDGDTTKTYPLNIQGPENAKITITQDPGWTVGSQTERADGPSQTWYSDSYIVPYQYGVSFIDESGNESKIQAITDIGVGKREFVVDSTGANSGNNRPMYISIEGLYNGHPSGNPSVAGLVSQFANTSNGRHRLYRVGGNSAYWKYVADLWNDPYLTLRIENNFGDLSSANRHWDFEILQQTWHKDLQYKIVWYNHGDGIAGGYKYTNSDGSVSQGDSGSTEWMYGTIARLGIVGYYYWHKPIKAIIEQAVGTPAASQQGHNCDFFLMVRYPGERVEREYCAGAYTVRGANGNNTSNQYKVNYIDWAMPDALPDINPIEEDNHLPIIPDFLKESNNIFFAGKDKRIYMSEYAKPTSWPTSQFFDLDYEITGMHNLGAELIVFTAAEIWRVFGNDPTNIARVRIPTRDTLPQGADKCIAKIKENLVYPSHSGICSFNGQSVERLTVNKIDNFKPPSSSKPQKWSDCAAGSHDSVYYLVGNDPEGYVVDFRNGVQITKTTQTGNAAYYELGENALYFSGGKVVYNKDDLEREAWTIKTKEFIGDDENEEKMFYGVSVDATDFEGTIEAWIDGQLSYSWLSTPKLAQHERTFYFDKPKQGNALQVRIAGAVGVLNRINVWYDMAKDFSDVLFNYVNMKYTGTPTFEVSLDGQVMTTKTMTPAGDSVGEGKIYFPAGSIGKVPFVKETSHELNGRMTDAKFNATTINMQ